MRGGGRGVIYRATTKILRPTLPDKAMNDERSLNHVYFEWHNIKCATTSICFDESVTNFQLFTF